MTSHNTTSTAKRIAQVIAGLNIFIVLAGIFLIAIPFVRLLTTGDVMQAAIFNITAVVYSIFGVLIIARQPRHTVGWLLLIIGFVISLNSFGSWLPEPEIVNMPEDIKNLGGWAGHFLWVPALLFPLTLVLQFFPDGHLPSRRWWPVPAVSLLSIISMVTGFAFHPYPWVEHGILETYNPVGIPGSEQILSSVVDAATFLFGFALIGSMASVVVRFRRSEGVERLQMKWLVYTAAVTFAALMLQTYLPLDPEVDLGTVIIQIFPSVLAVVIGLAILRYRLFDIDIIIRRTLVYGLLTAILLAFYFALVLALQSLVTAVGGQQSTLAIVISTLVIAALFNPLRRRIQDLIDRRFYRRRYNAEETLAGFSLTAREEVDLENLSVALLSVVAETIQPESASVWLKESSE